jgi:hypothetical protein
MRWGRWTYDPKRLALYYIDDRGFEIYEIRLDECNTSAEILDWIAQINTKTWASSQDIGELVKALDDLLSFQGKFCGGGKESSNGSIDYAKRIVERKFKR